MSLHVKLQVSDVLYAYGDVGEGLRNMRDNWRQQAMFALLHDRATPWLRPHQWRPLPVVLERTIPEALRQLGYTPLTAAQPMP